MPPTQQKPKYLDISPEDLAKVNRNRAKREAIQIDQEQMFIAEFGKHYGFEGVRAILNNEIDADTAAWLLLAARKVDSKTLYQNAQAVFVGTASSKSKKPSQAFKKATDKIIKHAQADL
jgi:hypothetical protein